MKTYEEKTAAVLKRIKEEQKMMKNKRKLAVNISAISLCAALVVMLGITAVRHIGRQNAPNIDDITTPSQSDIISNNADVIYTDKVILPESGGVSLDMIGVVVYKGHAYTQAFFSNADEFPPKELIGEYLGEAKGTLDEWSTQDDYAVEFASTYDGPIYSVKGYGEDFMLCYYWHYEGDEYVEYPEFIMFMTNFDNIPLRKGADLFEDRLHMNGRISSAYYQLHDDWDIECKSFKPLEGVSEERFREFFRQLDEGRFVRIDLDDTPDFYKRPQGHMYIHLSDGMIVQLHLVEGGYVGFTGLGGYYVQMSGEVFDEILAAVNR